MTPTCLSFPRPPRRAAETPSRSWVVFQITIDPATSLADLLPRIPKTAAATQPPLVEDLAKVPEVVFQEPLSRDLTSEKAAFAIANQLASMRHLNKKKTDGFVEAFLG